MAAAAVRSAKQSLRAELKQRLRALSAEERRRQSRLLTEKVIAHSQYQKSKRISIFLSMPDEIDTEEIIKDMFQRGKTCFIPRYQFQSNHMDMVRLASPEEISSLPKTSWNIHQPGEDEVREEAFSTGTGTRTPVPLAWQFFRTQHSLGILIDVSEALTSEGQTAVEEIRTLRSDDS
ncbi:5-formyltetrahydrofolate cyclo-ligase isoform X4 [Tamandua tetradactyla]|uniref:5-formyltetrahydrofolate cyclo-ligase isoform X4 n=1 Tax=Tamandua tetradactyla TaxID=48850 RepID=UPI00405450C9